MEINFYKRKEYANYLKVLSEDKIKDDLAMIYNNDYFKSDYFSVNIERPKALYTYIIPNEFIDFCERVLINDNVSLYNILCPINNFIGMETDDINVDNAVVLDESLLEYLDIAIRHIKLHDDSIFFDFNTDNKIISANEQYKFVKDIPTLYVYFKELIEKIENDLSKYRKEFKYAEIVAAID